MIPTTQPPPAGYRKMQLVQSLQQHTVFTSCAYVFFLKSAPHLAVIPTEKNTQLLYLDPEFKLEHMWDKESLFCMIDDAKVWNCWGNPDKVKGNVQYVNSFVFFS